MTAPTLLITGASRGIGAETARIAAELGANVVLSARSEADLAAVAQRITGAGGQALAVPGDVSHKEDCERLVLRAVERFGGIDAVVNNAASLEPLSPFAATDPLAWQRCLAVNVFGPAMMTHAALPHLRRRKGRIINVTSGAASVPLTGLSAYCSSKAALNMLSQVLAKEEPELTVIAFDPGVVETAMQVLLRDEGGSAMASDDHAIFMGLQQQGKLTSPDVPARVLAHVALRAPHDWTGTILVWDDERAAALAGA
jgi:NAD(P)-dependent dehydrogenase (short-subunit alcohol dehydrogenase family)